MIQLVLEDASLKVIGLDLNGVAVEVNTPKQYLAGPNDGPMQPRHRQATLFELPFPTALNDLGVDEHAGPVVTVEHEHPPAHTNLGCGKADTGGVVHDVEHLIDKADKVPVDLGDLTGTLAQDGIANHSDVVGCHGPKASVAPMAGDAPGAHYFSSNPDGAGPESAPATTSLVVDGQELALTTDTGVFSHGHVDDGTRLLIDRGARPDPGARNLLDLGCGYGPLALALAVRCPQATVWAVDTNQRAVALCGANARSNGLTNVRAIAVDADPPLGGLDPSVTFEGIWSNPPIRIGKPALHALLLAALARATPGHGAHLVVHRHLGADSLQGWLNANDHPTTRRLSRLGFRLLDVDAATTTPMPGPEGTASP